MLTVFLGALTGCPAQECTYNSDCTRPDVCLSGKCVAECQTQVDCARGYDCINQSCVAPNTGGSDAGTTQSCVYNSECAEPNLCFQGQCRAECLRTVDCEEGYVCRESRCTRSGNNPGGGNGDAGTGGNTGDAGTGGSTGDAGTGGGSSDAGSSGPSCTNGIKDGTETDTDCGGSTCGKCVDTKACQSASDCASSACQSNVCVATQLLTLTLSGSGSGMVASSPAGLTCTSGSCQGRFARGTSVTLTATPNEHASFTGWSGSGCSGTGTCTLALDADKSVTAAFTIKETGTLDWQKVLGGRPSGGFAAWESGSTAAFDGSGNVMFAGYFSNPIDFGGGPLSPVNGTNDIFVVKYTGAGAHLWSRRFGNGGSEDSYAAATNAAGDVFLSGFIGSQFSAGGPLMPCTQGVFLARYASATGTHLWSSCFAYSTYPSATIEGVVVDANGDIYVTGYPGGATDFGGGVLTGFLFVAKFSGANGSHLWSKSFGTNGVNTTHLAMDGEGNLLISGSFHSTLQIGTTSLLSVGAEDIFVLKLSPTGSLLWARSYGDSFTDEARGVAVDADGSVLLTGGFQGSVDFGGGPLTSAGNMDIFLLKLAGSNGAHQWSRRFGGSGLDIANAVATGPAGVVAITGTFDSSNLNLGTGALANQYPADIFVAKYTATGAPLWANTPGSSNMAYDSTKAIALDANGAAAVTGYSQTKLLMMKLAP